MTATIKTKTKPTVETLAKLYLNQEPAIVSEEIKTEFCDWILEQFQELPFAVQADYTMHYHDATEMFEDIKQEHLWVSMAEYDSEFYNNSFCGFALLAVHDYDHYQTQSCFTLEGEIQAYKKIASRAPNLEIQKIL
ncbi:MAG: transposase [Cyanobacteria bacterium SW_9_44_58]|nr:MAG: transposase [Cyanobacteria bacterium SW_9_44_58]